MGTPFKMKGSPMQRNFGISPLKDKPSWKERREYKKFLKSVSEDKKEIRAYAKHYKKTGTKTAPLGYKGADDNS